MTDFMSQQSTASTKRADDLLLEPKTLAKMLGLTVRALEAWRLRGEGPYFIRISSRCIRYRRSDVEAWLEQRVHGTSAV